jgi:hypothetical protein
MIKYKTDRYAPTKIEVVEVLRETEKTVYRASVCIGRPEYREAKKTEYHQYHDTWEAAHAHLLKRATTVLENARAGLALAQGTLGNVKGMKPPIP